MSDNDKKKPLSLEGALQAARAELSSKVSLISHVSIVLVLAIMGLYHFHLLPIAWLEALNGAAPRWTDTIILVLLIVVVEHVVTISTELHKPSLVQIFPESQLAYAALANALQNRPAHTVDLIQFTGYAAHHFLEQLGHNSQGAKVRILLQHPDVAKTFDIGRVSHISNIHATVNHLTVGLKGKVDAIIKYYRTPASVAAVLVDNDLLAISWYRHFKDSASVEGQLYSPPRGQFYSPLFLC